MQYLFPLNETLLFTRQSSASASELWKTNGTSGGTVLIKTLAMGRAGIVNGTLFFSGSDPGSGLQYGNELWKSNGTTSATVMVKDLWPGPQGAFDYAFSEAFDGLDENFTAVNDEMFFTFPTFTNGTFGFELWKTDGTAAGTQLVKALHEGTLVGGHIAVGGTLFFTSAGYSHLWKSDGTPEGTVLLLGNISPDPGVVSSHQWLVDLNGTLVFQTNDGVHGNELWRSDGTPEGTMLIKDILPGRDVHSYFVLGVANGSIFVGVGTELWKSDGTAAGTVKLIDNLHGEPGGTRGCVFREPPLAQRCTSASTMQPTGANCGRATGQRQGRGWRSILCQAPPVPTQQE